MNINFADGEILGEREDQQDYKANLIIDQRHMLYILADGMGGHIGGAIASKTVGLSILKYFENHEITNVEQNLLHALEDANSALTDILREQPELNGMGTTLILLIQNVDTHKFWYISVGDSPLYLYQPQQGIRRINANHAYYEELLDKVRAGEITQEQADSDQNRNAITSALMGKKIPLKDMGVGQLQQPGDMILMASDGVQTLTDGANGQIEELLAKPGTLEQRVNDLLSAVQNSGDPHQDNTTVILISMSSDNIAHNNELPVTQEIEDGQDLTKQPKNSSRLPFWILPVFVILLSIILFLGWMLFVSGNEEIVVEPEPKDKGGAQKSLVTLPNQGGGENDSSGKVPTVTKQGFQESGISDQSTNEKTQAPDETNLTSPEEGSAQEEFNEDESQEESKDEELEEFNGDEGGAPVVSGGSD